MTSLRLRGLVNESEEYDTAGTRPARTACGVCLPTRGGARWETLWGHYDVMSHDVTSLVIDRLNIWFHKITVMFVNTKLILWLQIPNIELLSLLATFAAL